MKAIKKTLLFILLLVISFSVFSQKQDYIVTLKGDTVYGYLKFIFGQARELVNDEHNYTIDQDHVEAYFSAEKQKLFRRRALPDKKNYRYLACIESGKISLYELYYAATANAYGGTRETIIYYAEKENGKLVEVWTNKSLFGLGNKNKKQKEAFAILIDDSPVVKEMFIKDNKYDAVDVGYYIHEYNKNGSKP